MQRTIFTPLPAPIEYKIIEHICGSQNTYFNMDFAEFTKLSLVSKEFKKATDGFKKTYQCLVDALLIMKKIRLLVNDYFLNEKDEALQQYLNTFVFLIRLPKDQKIEYLSWVTKADKIRQHFHAYGLNAQNFYDIAKEIFSSKNLNLLERNLDEKYLSFYFYDENYLAYEETAIHPDIQNKAKLLRQYIQPPLVNILLDDVGEGLIDYDENKRVNFLNELKFLMEKFYANLHSSLDKEIILDEKLTTDACCARGVCNSFSLSAILTAMILPVSVILYAATTPLTCNYQTNLGAFPILNYHITNCIYILAKNLVIDNDWSMEEKNIIVSNLNQNSTAQKIGLAFLPLALTSLSVVTYQIYKACKFKEAMSRAYKNPPDDLDVEENIPLIQNNKISNYVTLGLFHKNKLLREVLVEKQKDLNQELKNENQNNCHIF